MVAELRPGEVTETEVPRIERDEQAGMADLGLRLIETRQLMTTTSQIVPAQAGEQKPRPVTFGSLFGDVPVRVQRLLTCLCQSQGGAKSFTALDFGHDAVAPELAYVTARYEALALFGKVAVLLCELPPISRAQNAGTVRNRTLRVGEHVVRQHIETVSNVGVVWVRLAAADQDSEMKWRVMVELIGSDGAVHAHEVNAGGSNTAEYSAEMVGLTLADEKRTLAGLQGHLVRAQTREYCRHPRLYSHCGWQRPLKDVRARGLLLVFGTVAVRAPRFLPCRCAVNRDQAIGQSKFALHGQGEIVSGIIGVELNRSRAGKCCRVG